MTSPALAGVTSESFNRVHVPPQLLNQIINLALVGSPFARSLTLLSTASGSVAFPVASPTGFDWVPEAAPLPLVDLNDDAVIVAVAKLSGVISVSNESWSDASLPLVQLVGRAIADSMGPSLDDGLLHGTGEAGAPAGVLATIPVTPAASLFAGVVNAAAEIASAGGQASTVYLPAAMWAAEAGREGPQGPLYPAGLTSLAGLAPVLVPKLSEADGAIVADTSRAWLVQRQDFSVELSDQVLFMSDQVALRVKGRFAAAIPDVNKTARRVQLSGSPGEGFRSAQPSGTSASSKPAGKAK